MEISCGTVSSGDELNRNYWNDRWEKEETGWDIGYASPPIEDYLAQYKDKNAKILIPGCGNAHEAEYLLENGFTDVTILDISDFAVNVLKEKFKNTSEIKVICKDFFTHEGKYDLMIEQTFFCAIPTIMRNNYATKAAELLNENGRIIGVLFNKIFEKKGPPFGGTEAEYRFIFKKYFEIEKMESCHNSIPQRLGNELFINLKKK